MVNFVLKLAGWLQPRLSITYYLLLQSVSMTHYGIVILIIVAISKGENLYIWTQGKLAIQLDTRWKDKKCDMEKGAVLSLKLMGVDEATTLYCSQSAVALDLWWLYFLKTVCSLCFLQSKYVTVHTKKKKVKAD